MTDCGKTLIESIQSEINIGISHLEKAVGTGKAIVFYAKPYCDETGVNIRLGKFDNIDINNIHNTHNALCFADENMDQEDIFWNLQGENWSPNGEANALIHMKGLSHTSMSVGDIIAYPIENGSQYKIMFVANVGFRCLGFVEKSQVSRT